MSFKVAAVTYKSSPLFKLRVKNLLVDFLKGTAESFLILSKFKGFSNQVLKIQGRFRKTISDRRES